MIQAVGGNGLDIVLKLLGSLYQDSSTEVGPMDQCWQIELLRQLPRGIQTLWNFKSSEASEVANKDRSGFELANFVTG